MAQRQLFGNSCSSGLSAILTFTARTVTATENSLGKGTGADLFQLDSLHSFVLNKYLNLEDKRRV